MYEQKTSKRGGLRCWGAALLAALLLIPAFAAEADAVTTQSRRLVPVGRTVGIKLFSRGILVVGLTEGASPARSCGLEAGDVILSCNGSTVSSTEQFQSMVSAGEELALQVDREDSRTAVTVQPERNDQGAYAIGAWVRDSMAGIGTMTYYDPESGIFGALGHGVTDTDTACLMPFASGSILPSAVKAVKRGEPGSAGELRGDFQLSTDLGGLFANTDRGIFGRLASPEYLPPQAEALPVAPAAEVTSGPAVIRSNVAGEEVRDYAVELTRLSPGGNDPRQLLVTVTDPALLAATGGIVQGMSGSPIIQDGKLVGAVTHVLLNDPTRGYGIFIENMLEAAG